MLEPAHAAQGDATRLQWHYTVIVAHLSQRHPLCVHLEALRLQAELVARLRLGSRFCTKNMISEGTNRASLPYLVAHTS